MTWRSGIVPVGDRESEFFASECGFPVIDKVRKILRCLRRCPPCFGRSVRCRPRLNVEHDSVEVCREGNVIRIDPVPGCRDGPIVIAYEHVHLHVGGVEFGDRRLIFCREIGVSAMICGEVYLVDFLSAADVDGLEFGNPGVGSVEEFRYVPDVEAVFELGDCGRRGCRRSRCDCWSWAWRSRCCW